MITFEEALTIVESVSVDLISENIDFRESLNRVLASDIKSDMDLPPFDKSAVDGFACRKEDLGNKLKVIEVIPAGKAPEKSIVQNECARIMTGAPIPSGANVVVMVEDVEEIENNFIRYRFEKVKQNICYKGEDVRLNEQILKKGTLIRPQHIAVLATAGCANPLVYKKVKVSVISTGDELVEPWEKPSNTQIRNSNAYQVLSQAMTLGAETNYSGIALDNEESTRQKLSEAFGFADIIILTGGVSMGDFDYVPAILEEFGIKIKFRSIAVQPGRPTIFGVKGNKFVFGLPGNPVSSFVQFELLAKPLINKLMGHNYEPLKIKLPMGMDYSRKKSSRMSLLPVQISRDSEIIPVEYHGSAHINALIEAHGIIAVPIGVTNLRKGEMVDVRQI
jgi:molybdopterin molybdotransferase